MATATAEKTGSRVKAPAKPQFTVEGRALLDALTALTKVAPTTASMMASLRTAHVVISDGEIIMTATDLETTATVHLPVSKGVDGEFLLPAKSAMAIAKAAGSGELTISQLEAMKLSFAAGDYTGSITTVDVDDFPKLSAPTEGQWVEVDALAFRGGLKRVIAAASKDDSRVVLTAVLFSTYRKNLRLVATDSYRLAVANTSQPSFLDQDLLVPASTMTALSALFRPDDEALSIRVSPGTVEFSFRNLLVRTRQVTGDFPRYENLIPSAKDLSIAVSIDRAQLIDAVVRATVFAVDSTPVRLEVDGDKVTVRAVTTEDESSEQLDCKTSGLDERDGKIDLSYNPDYLLDGLRTHEGKTVEINVADPLKPATITAKKEPSTYLVMPVKVPS